MCYAHKHLPCEEENRRRTNKRTIRFFLILAAIISALLFIKSYAYSQELQVELQFPEAGGATACFNSTHRSRQACVKLFEEELPASLSEVGIREYYHKKFFDIILFAGTGGDSHLYSTDPIVQEILDALELIED